MDSHILETQRQAFKARWMQVVKARPWESDSASHIRFPLCSSHKMAKVLLQEGGPLPGPKSGLLSNTRK